MIPTLQFLFLWHNAPLWLQIRKMIGLAVDIIRGGSSADIFDKCFSRTEKVRGCILGFRTVVLFISAYLRQIDILMVPGLGLYLKELFWDRYHAKLDCENEKNDKIRQKLIEKAALPGSTVDVEKELALRGTGTAVRSTPILRVVLSRISQHNGRNCHHVPIICFLRRRIRSSGLAKSQRWSSPLRSQHCGCTSSNRLLHMIFCLCHIQHHIKLWTCYTHSIFECLGGVFSRLYVVFGSS